MTDSAEGQGGPDGPDPDAPNKGAAAWGQALMALILVPAFGVGMWAWGEAQNTGVGAKPAVCRGGEEKKGAAQVSGAQLCAALHRPDLADLLGTPGQPVKYANGGGSTSKPAGGTEVFTPSAEVEFETYTVKLTASYGSVPVARYAALLGDRTAPRAVLGRPAAFSSDRTIQIRFRLDGSDSSSGPGVPTRTVTVARDAADTGDSYDLTAWRKDGGPLDDAALIRVAEAVLPTVPGWDGPGGVTA